MKSKRVFDQIARTGLLLSTVSASVLLSANALAVETKPHKVGGTEVNSMITSSLGYGDNIFRGLDNETSSGFFSIKPQVEVVRESADHRLSFDYEGDGFVFFDSSDDNYLSNRVAGDYARKLSSTSEFSIGAAFEDGSTVRGTDITEGTNGDVEGATDFTRKDFLLGYRIGSEKAGPSLELGYNYTDLEFDNFDLVNQGRDYELDTLSARLGYQYSVATKFFVDLSYSDFDYDRVAASFGGELDNSEQAILVGMQWRLSRLTTGEISVGVIDKEFDNFQDPSSLTTWNVELTWTPTARDTITVEGFSKPFEQAGAGTFQEVEQATVKWEHDLSRTISFRGGLTLGSVDFEDVSRDDDFDSVELGLFYRPTRYSEWSLNYQYEEKDSSLSQFDFETNTVFVSYAVSL
jgi:hypothetical protein